MSRDGEFVPKDQILFLSVPALALFFTSLQSYARDFWSKKRIRCSIWDTKMEQIVFGPSFKQRGEAESQKSNQGKGGQSCSAGGAITEQGVRRRRSSCSVADGEHLQHGACQK